MTAPLPQGRARRVVVGALLGVLLVLGGLVLRPFLIPLAWAMVIACAAWPAYRPLRARLGHHDALSALLMTLLLTAAVALPALWMLAHLRDELGLVFGTIGERIEQEQLTLPDMVRHLPWIGPWLEDVIEQVRRNPDAYRTMMGEGGERLLGFVGDVGRNAVKFSLALLTLFFIFRDGERVLVDLQRLLVRFLGERLDTYLAAVVATTRAVLWGIVVTAIGQGVTAGLGYWWAGVPAPVLFGAATALLAMIPFAAPLGWGPVVVWLLLVGRTTEGLALLAWGVLVVSSVDNVLRPIVISNATRIPFLPVLFGVVGGLAAFGLIGLFLGPLVLAVLIAVWREWIEDSRRRLIEVAQGAEREASVPPPGGGA